MDLSAALAAARAAGGVLGLDLAGLDRIEQLLQGALQLAVAGSRSRSRAALVEALQGARPAFCVAEAGAPGVPLVDGVVIATPADAALSSVELDLVDSARKAGVPAFVAVTDTGRFGPQRAAAERELRDLRLAPLLDERSVSWWFLDGGEPSGVMLDALDALARRHPACHEPPARSALARWLEAGIAAYAQRVAIRDREEAALAALVAQTPSDVSHLREAERLAVLKARNGLRAAYEGVLEAASGTADALQAWTRAQCPDDGTTAIAGLLEAWQGFGRELEAVPERAASEHAAEVARLALRFSEAALTLGLEKVERSTAAVPSVEAMSEAAEAIRRIDLEALARSAAKGARAMSQERRGKPNAARGGKPARGGALDRARSAVAALASAGELPLVDRVRATLLDGTKTLADRRFEAYLELASAWVREKAARTSDAWLADLDRGTSTLRALLAARHAWNGAFGTLTQLLSAVDGGAGR